MLTLYDTLGREPRELDLAAEGEVGMYVCGPTVYQRAHIGNARPFIVFGWLKRWIEHQGFRARFVHNITDVNDKIYDAAPTDSAAHARRAAAWYIEDITRFGLGLPDDMPTVTGTMDEIVQFIQGLLDGGFAYAADGDVYFSVSAFPGYGTLSGRTEEQQGDEDPSELKRDPRDFALWKARKEGEDTWWPAPWGEGRPGWHIECSAMAHAQLGETFAIHGGGLDLVFPHHENERAQSQALGYGFASIWMHNGMVELSGEKMSKSLRNDETMEKALDRWGPQILLLLFMSAHWRSPMEYSPDTLKATSARLDTLLEALHRTPATDAPEGEWDRVVAALNDNFNTPAALALLHEWAEKGYHELAARVLDVFGLGALLEQEPPAAVRTLAEQRDGARAGKDWAEADRLRDEIAAAGWQVGDGPSGSTLFPTHRLLLGTADAPG